MKNIAEEVRQRWPQWELSPPPEGDPGVGRWAWNKFETMRQYRDGLGIPQLWLRFHELYRGKIFRRRSKQERVAPNLVFKAINSLTAHLTDNKPTADISSRGEASSEGAKIWQAAYDTWWNMTMQQKNLQDSVFRSELYGVQTDKMVFDINLEGGLGEVRTVRLDNFCVFFWPGSVDNVQNAPMVASCEAMELGEIYRRWPKAKGKVKAESEWSELTGETRKKIRQQETTAAGPEMRPIGGQNFYHPEDDFGQEFGLAAGDVGRALVVELWVKDYSTEPDPENPEEERAKYPGCIRCLHVTNNGNMLLSDVANPSINPNLPREVTAQSYLYDKFPFIRRFSYSDDICEYGLSVVEQMDVLVLEIAKKLSKIGMHLDRSALPPLLLPQNCGVSRDDINNLAARIWSPIIAMASQIRFLQIPSLPPDYMHFIQFLMQLVDIVTGLTDVSEGRRPSGITAASAISSLQEKAFTILRAKIRNLDCYLEEQGRMYISLAQNWYTEERYVIFIDQPTTFIGTDQVYQGEYAFKIEAGSTVPSNRWARRQQALDLAKSGMIDQEALLIEFNVPNRDRIIERMRQGAVGVGIERLQKTGLFDDATLQAAQQILALSDDEFKRQFNNQTSFPGR